MKTYDYIEKEKEINRLKIAALAKVTKFHDMALSKIAHEYAMAHNLVEIGDIITSSHGSIKVAEIKFTAESCMAGLPECIYLGPKLTKKGIPFKTGETVLIYQANLTSINEKPVSITPTLKGLGLVKA